MRISKLLDLIDTVPSLAKGQIIANGNGELILEVPGQLIWAEHKFMLKKGFIKDCLNNQYLYRPRYHQSILRP